MIRSWRGADPDGVYITEHVAEAVVPDRTHEPLKVPVLFETKAKVPVGVMNVPSEVSVTVTLHVEAVPTVTGEVQLIVVDVVRGFTVMLVVPLLPL